MSNALRLGDRVLVYAAGRGGSERVEGRVVRLFDGRRMADAGRKVEVEFRNGIRMRVPYSEARPAP